MTVGRRIPNRPLRTAPRRRAVTLVELLMVAVLLSLTATIVVSAGGNAAALRADEVASRIQGDLDYARSMAILLRKPQSVVCDTGQGLYHLAPASTATVPATDPVSKKPLRVLFGKASRSGLSVTLPCVETYADVELITADFDGAAMLTFNAMGMPLASDGMPLVSGKMEIRTGSESLQVLVDPVSGSASVQRPAG